MTVATKRAIFVLFRGDFRLIWEQQIFWKADQILPPPQKKSHLALNWVTWATFSSVLLIEISKVLLHKNQKAVPTTKFRPNLVTNIAATKCSRLETKGLYFWSKRTTDNQSEQSATLQWLRLNGILFF